MKKYKKHIAITVALLLAYYFFFYKKEDAVEYIDDGLGVIPPDTTPSDTIDTNSGKRPANQLRMKHSMVLLKPSIDHVPTTAGKWYGRDRIAAKQAHYDTGCSFVEGPNGTYGCF